MNASKEVKVFTVKLLIVTLAVIVLLFSWRIASVLLLFFAAILAALLLHFAAAFLGEKLKLGHRLSLGLTILLIVLTFVVAGYFVAAPLTGQLQGIVSGLPASIEALRDTLSSVLPAGWAAEIALPPNTLEDAVSAGGGFASSLFGAFTSFFHILTAFIIFVVSVIYLAANPSYYRQGFLRLLPSEARDKADSMFDRADTELVKWLGGQLLVMFLIGAITTIGLTALGVPFALGLGFLAGLLELIPTVGPFIAAIPAILLALTVSPTLALYAGLFYLVLQQLEGNILVPLIYQRTVSLPPVLTLFAVLALGSLFGLLGLLLAAPLLICIRILIDELYLKNRHG